MKHDEKTVAAISAMIQKRVDGFNREIQGLVNPDLKVQDGSPRLTELRSRRREAEWLLDMIGMGEF
jgi:hypothetical protein